MACGGCGSSAPLTASRRVARSGPIATNQPSVITQRHINNGLRPDGSAAAPTPTVVRSVRANHLEPYRA